MRLAAYIGASLLCAGLYVHAGIGFVLDDWFWLRNAHFDGALHAAGATGGDRPLGAVVYVVLFGFLQNAASAVLLLAIVNGVSGYLIFRLLRTWTGGPVAGLAALLWIVLPLRTSLEAWSSTGTAVLAQVLMLSALVILDRESPSPGQVGSAGLLLVAATLSYETFAALSLPAALAIRWLHRRRIEWPTWLYLSACTLLTVGWAYLHRLGGRDHTGRLANPLLALEANFGAGIVRHEQVGDLLLVAALVGSGLLLWSALRGARVGSALRRVRILGVGWLIVVGGALPFVTYYYVPFGLGDRLNVLSAFGAALVWSTLCLSPPRPVLRAAATASLVAVGVWGRFEQVELWSRASADAQRVADTVVDVHRDPDRPIVVGPIIVRYGTAGLIDHSNVAAMLQLAYDDRDVEARMAPTEADLEAAAAQGYIVFDQRSVASLDDVP